MSVAVWKRVGSIVGLLALVGALLWLGAAEAAACSTPPSVSIEDVVEAAAGADGRVVGVYETTVIAYAGAIPLRDARSVSVVTRWWGQPPARLGPWLQGQDAFLRSTSCPNGARRLGRVDYETVTGAVPNLAMGLHGHVRPAGTVVSHAESAALEEVLGPSHTRRISTEDRVSAFIMLWKDPLIGVLAVGALGFVAGRLLTRRRPVGNRPEPDDVPAP